MKKIYTNSNDVKKIVFIDKEDTDLRKMSEIAKIVEATGKSEKYKGFENSAPTIYRKTERFNEVFSNGKLEYEGGYYEEHPCEHRSIRVFCLEGIIDFESYSKPPIYKFMKMIKE